MRKFSLAIAAAGIIAGLSLPASAQNVANNNGIWWGGQPGPSAFTMLNPLTTVYGRIGLSYSFLESSSGAAPFPFNSIAFPGSRASPADAWGGDLAMGFRLMPAIRYDLSLGGIINTRANWTNPLVPIGSIGSARVSSVQLMNNIYLDLAPLFGGLGAFNAYITGGIGVAFNSVGETTGFPAIPGAPLFVGNTRTVFAWTAGAGAQYQIMNNMILDVSYRYLDAGRAQTNFGVVAIPGFNQTSAEIVAHQIRLGLVIPVDGLFRGY